MVKHVTARLRELKIGALGIHEGFSGAERKDYFRSKVPDPKNENTSPFDVWVHQNKLTEGLDDNRFCVLAIMNRIRNDRKLVQQMGRTLRRAKNETGKAVVLYSRNLRTEQSWDNYREFELNAGDMIDPDRYYCVLETVLQQQPAKEYFAGTFRSKFDPNSEAITDQLLLNASVVVRRTLHGFDWDKFASYVTDFLFLEDRIVLGPEKDVVAVDQNTFVWVYAIIGNSTILTSYSQYEVKLGALVAIRSGDLIFLSDTEGTYPLQFLAEYSSKVEPDQLARVFPLDVKPSEAALRNPWPVGPLVKRITSNAEDLRRTAVQLTDGTYVCAAVRGAFTDKMAGRRRQYVGFTTGRVSEQLPVLERSEFTIDGLRRWADELAGHLNDKKRKPSSYFHRFLQSISAPKFVVPAYVTFDFTHQGAEVDLTWTDGDRHLPVQLKESVVEVGRAGDEAGVFQCHLAFVDGDAPVGATEAKIKYDDKTKRFRFGNALNKFVTAVYPERKPEGLSSFLNNYDEAFVIALADPEIFYVDQAFYKINYSRAEVMLEAVLSVRPVLQHATSEKGEKPKPDWSHWPARTVFGLIDNRKPGSLLQTMFGSVEFLFCDDMDTESCDFMCVNFTNRKLAFLHAKCAHAKRSASALHDVVAQAVKNLNVSTRGGELPAKIARWTRTEKWRDTRINRWRCGSKALPERDALWELIRREILDHPQGQKEVWLVLGDTLESADLLDRIKGVSERLPETGQIVYLLSNLNSLCRQLGATLRVVCH
jgi:hypothetical protein